MEDEFDFSQAQVVDPYAIDYGYDKEEEEEEYVDPAKGIWDQLFEPADHHSRNETYEEREARQEEELRIKRERTLRDRYVLDSNGNPIIDPNTGQPVLEELDTWDKMMNSFANIGDMFSEFLGKGLE